nr:EOG090X0N7H [Megafenestra aurita]
MTIVRQIFWNVHQQSVKSLLRVTSFKTQLSTVRHSTDQAAIKHEHDDDMPVENLSNPYEKDKRCCILCKYNVPIDYKNPRLLSQFLSPFTGKVYERNITGLCNTQQKRVENEIIKSQTAGYLAIMLKKVEYIKDPKLYDPNRPVRPHRF